MAIRAVGSKVRLTPIELTFARVLPAASIADVHGVCDPAPPVPPTAEKVTSTRLLEELSAPVIVTFDPGMRLIVGRLPTKELLTQIAVTPALLIVTSVQPELLSATVSVTLEPWMKFN